MKQMRNILILLLCAALLAGCGARSAPAKALEGCRALLGVREGFLEGRAAELALPSILGRLSGVRFADYTDVAFLAKSLGTLCAVRTAKVLGLRPRFFLLTPLEETLQELPQGADVFGAVVGTKDAHLAADQLEQFCKARAIPCLIVPDAGHRLQFEDADKTQAVNRSITAMLR